MCTRRIDCRVTKLVLLVAQLLPQHLQINVEEMSHQHSAVDELPQLRQSLLRHNTLLNVVRPQLVNNDPTLVGTRRGSPRLWESTPASSFA